MTASAQPVGGLVRRWRQRRRLSQLELALEADISARHLSFIETGRSLPSRRMVLHLAERLDVPLRERNSLLLAAGYAPAFPERSWHDGALASARGAIELLLTAHEPYPALAVDRHWTLVASNRAVMPLLAGVSPALLEPPVNVLRIGLRPDGLASRIENLAEWRGHLLARLGRQVDASGDPVLAELLRELRAYATPVDANAPDDPTVPDPVVVPLRLATDLGTLAFISTTTVLGAPMDVTLSELALETFLPADAATRAALHELARREAPPPS